jgi:multiple sugar transport system permease protein
MTVPAVPTVPAGPTLAEDSRVAAAPIGAKRNTRVAMPAIAWWIICSCIAVLFALPLFVSLVSSLRPPAVSQGSPQLIPTHVSFGNFHALNKLGSGIRDYLRNSVLVAAGTVLGTVVLSTLAGFGFAKFRFPGRRLAFLAVILMLMIPFQAIVTPLYVLLVKVKLSNSLIGLAAVYITYQLPFSIFVMRNSFAAIPDALQESAHMDGCSTWRAFTRVMLPLAVPGTITVALFAFFTAWNEFFAALIFLSSQGKYTLPVMLTLIQGQQYGQVDWGLLQAGVMVTMLPCIVIFVTLQRYYVQGMLSGSVK